MDLKGKTVLVSGASSGIGAHTARMAAHKGAHVIMLARNEERLRAIHSDITAAGGTADFFCLDLADSTAVVSCAEKIIAAEPPVDVLVNNAGAGHWLSVLETSPEQLERMMAVPYFASFNLTREFLPGMIRRGRGHIVNVTSVASRLIWPGSAAYTATRWAINGFNEALRSEVADLGLGVTLAMFGKVSSDYWQHNPGSEERLPRITQMVPTITPQQAAQSIVRAVEKNRKFVLKPGMLHMVLWMNGLFPDNMAYVMRKTGWHHADANTETQRPLGIEGEK